MSGAIPLLPICICGYLNGIVTVCPYTAVVNAWDAAITVSHYSHLLQEAPLCVWVLTCAYIGRHVGQISAHFPRPWAIHLVESAVRFLPTCFWQSPHHYQALPVENEIMELEGLNLLRARCGFGLSIARHTGWDTLQCQNSPCEGLENSLFDVSHINIGLP